MATTEATPGQAFRATLIDRWSARGRCVDGRSWDQLPKEDRDDLEAAADAALIVAIPVVATRLAEATEENTRLMLTFDSHVRETGKIVGERDQLAAKLARALAANQRWAETLGDVQRRHTEVKRERDEARKACVAAGHSIDEASVAIDVLTAERDELRNALTLARIAAREMADEFITWTVAPEDQERIAAWRQRAGLEADGE